MNTTNISYARNHLSELISRVREGETVLIMDRHKPVARLEPAGTGDGDRSPVTADLVRRGLVRPARKALDPKALSVHPLPAPRKGGDILSVLRAEREEGR